MAHMTLGDRAATANDQLVGKTLVVVTICDEDEYCSKCPHAQGTYTLLAQEAGEWLAFSNEENKIVWLPAGVRVVEPSPKWTTNTTSPSAIELQSPTPRSIALSIAAIVKPCTVNKDETSQPGYFWAYQLCSVCGLFCFHSNLLLETNAAVRQCDYNLAILPKFRSDNLILALRAGQALCNCSSRG